MALGNPFARDREGDTPRNVNLYKAATIGSWLLNVIFTFMYVTGAPHDGNTPRHSLFGQSNHNLTPFTPSHTFISVFWITLFIAQLGYVWHLFSGDEAHVKAATSVGSHFVSFNLLQFAWVMLFARTHTVWSEIILIINFVQLLALYFRHSTTPRFVHLPAVAMPLTWTYYAIFWNGAIMVHCHSLACRILANVAIWSFLLYALFFLLVFKDYYIGFTVSWFMAGLGVGQLWFAGHLVALQWVFAFTIMGLVFILTVLIAIPSITSGQTGFEAGSQNHHTAGTDRERAPLLEDA